LVEDKDYIYSQSFGSFLTVNEENGEYSISAVKRSFDWNWVVKRAEKDISSQFKISKISYQEVENAAFDYFNLWNNEELYQDQFPIF